MRKHTSLYLDALRILAALAVFFSHITRESLSANNPVILFLGQFGQEGVALFFVISGIVIAFVASEKEGDFRSFIVARLGRLWSVMVPALILTVVLDTTGRAIAPEMYASSVIQPWGWNLNSLWNFFAPLLFLNKIAFASAEPGTNGPFWSLCFEFWYYIMFGIAFYLRGAARLVLLVASAAIAGPRILELFPIWGFGLFIYFFLKRFSSTWLRIGISGWALTSIAVFTFMLTKFKIGAFVVAMFPILNLSSIDIANWISHFAVGFVCAFNIAVYDSSGGLAILRTKVAERSIRFLAARSFSLYLYQAPCIFFFGAVTYGMSSPILRIVIVIVMSLLTILALAEVTEMRKKWFVAAVDRLIPTFVPSLPDQKVRDEKLEDKVFVNRP
jgi:peptidoglycan/LPS O-acetylase OafA/YrhL